MMNKMINKVFDSYKKHLFAIVLGPVIKIIEAIFDLLIPLFMKAIIDLNQYSVPENIPNVISRSLALFIRSFPYESSPLNDALVGGGIILAMGVVGYAITMSSQYIAARTSTIIGCEVRDALFHKILYLSKRDREKIGQSHLLTVTNSDTYQLQHGVLLFTRLIVRAPFILIGSLIFSFILDWRVGIAYLVIVPLILLVNILVLRKTSRAYIDIQKDLDKLSSSTSEVVEGARVVRASNSEQLENEKFNEKTLNYQNKTIGVNKINSLINPLTFAITSIVLIVIIFLLQGDLFSSPNENVLVASTIIAEMSYLAQIFFVVVQLTQAVIDIVKAGVSRKRIDAILEIEPSIKDNEVINNKDEKEPLILFDHVYFSFNNNDESFLTDLCFQIRKGETFGIIGGTGSGKSTIAYLLERFYDVNKGEIRYQGVPLTNCALKELRNDIALVNQKSSLFKGTIKSNFLMANPSISDEEIIEVLKEAGAYEFVSKYEDGINHVVLEGGSNFSGGQKQRLSIARALAKKSPILILDDATSALDLLTDKRIRDTINKKKDITKIIISQRVSTIQNADYILVLEGGKVVGLGKHETLLKECPIYQEIYETQVKHD